MSLLAESFRVSTIFLVALCILSHFLVYFLVLGKEDIACIYIMSSISDSLLTNVVS